MGVSPLSELMNWQKPYPRAEIQRRREKISFGLIKLLIEEINHDKILWFFISIKGLNSPSDLVRSPLPAIGIIQIIFFTII
jgi:hypothetical protein